MLLILRGNDKIRDGDQLDQLIKAQLPDPADPKQKKLFEIVSQNMLHGPCGEKCLENGKCSKDFPKKFTAETNICEGGYPLYARPDNSFIAQKRLNGKTINVIKNI